MFPEINSAMLWDGPGLNGCSCFLFAHDNALFDLVLGRSQGWLLHNSQDHGWEILRRKRALMMLGHSDVHSFHGAHRE
jgi:hypothetical protein